MCFEFEISDVQLCRDAQGQHCDHDDPVTLLLQHHIQHTGSIVCLHAYNRNGYLQDTLTFDNALERVANAVGTDATSFDTRAGHGSPHTTVDIYKIDEGQTKVEDRYKYYGTLNNDKYIG